MSVVEGGLQPSLSRNDALQRLPPQSEAEASRGLKPAFQEVAAVIPHWNRADLLGALLENLKLQTRQFDEIVVADNGSTDDSAALAERAGARVLRLGRNLGFAAAVNRGVMETRRAWVAVLNNDVTLEPRWLEILVAAAEREKAWFAAGKTLSASEPGIVDGTFDEVSRAGCAWRCGEGRQDSPLWNQGRRIRIAPMTAALFRRSLFDRVGLLDESFGSYLEDVDFGIRCSISGLDGIYAPESVAYHRGSSTLGRWNKDTVRWIARNQVLLAAKHLRGQPRCPIVVGQLLWGLVALRHGRGLAYLQGKWEGVRAARNVQPQTDVAEAVRLVLEQSERTILELQRQTGFDRYWGAYFWLLRQ